MLCKGSGVIIKIARSQKFWLPSLKVIFSKTKGRLRERKIIKTTHKTTTLLKSFRKNFKN